ncbi:hypothetical protein SLS56_011485 [Neofusicoccum ribis]|uniref:HNH nuclease domain-containing protein n=1 Tax=Neofusicoccum ribis TaxID=45134 RepID=A0ABR3SBG1_9PEZI
MARWPTLRPAYSSPSSHPDGDAQASADPSHRILVRHPHYAPSASLLLLLHAPDHPDGGIHHETLRVWCAAIADNRFDGCLSDTRDGPETDTPRDHVLRCREYFFLVPGSSLEHPYPVVPAFSHWRFPTKLPSDWRALPIAGERLAPAHSSASDHILERDVSCRFSGSCEGVQAAHVVPRGELLWFKRNEMDTRILDVRRTDAQALDDVTNRFLLRADLHDVFDQGRLVIASKRRPAERGSSPSRPSLAIHVLAPSEELVRLYHNVDLKDLRGMAPEFLFARFVWSVFPQVQAFVSRGVRRRLRIYTEDGASETAWFSGDECSALSMPPPRPRSASSKRPRKRSISDFDLADQEPSHKRRATDSRRPCKQPLFSPPSDPSTPLTHIQRLRDDALKRERAAFGVENLVEEDLKWRDEAIGRTLSHEEAIRLYELWGLEVQREG